MRPLFSQPPPLPRMARKPNIVVIYCDDLGYADMGRFRAGAMKRQIFDRMAAEGMKFTDFYVAQAVCSASRTADY